MSLDRLIDQMFDFSDSEKQQTKKDLKEIERKTNEMGYKATVTAKSLREVADKLDKVWRDCKIAHAAGTSAEVTGGILTIGGGIATILTWGIASPLLVLGMGVGASGAVTNLGTSIVEAFLNSTEIKKAEKELKETLDYLNHVRDTVQKWLDGKEVARLLWIRYLHKQLNVKDPEAVAHTAGRAGAQAAVQVGTKTAGKAGTKAAGQAGVQTAGRTGAKAAGNVAETGAKTGAKAGSRLTGGLIIGGSIPFLVWDVIDLHFTIRDIVENRGSEAASFLRQKANELEEYIQYVKL